MLNIIALTWNVLIAVAKPYNFSSSFKYKLSQFGYETHKIPHKNDAFWVRKLWRIISIHW